MISPLLGLLSVAVSFGLKVKSLILPVSQSFVSFTKLPLEPSNFSPKQHVFIFKSECRHGKNLFLISSTTGLAVLESR
jgi:hypothetical protein